MNQLVLNQIMRTCFANHVEGVKLEEWQRVMRSHRHEDCDYPGCFICRAMAEFETLVAEYREAAC